MRTISLLLFSTLLILSLSWNYNNPFLKDFEPSNSLQQEWLTQSIDHFNYNSKATFQQRYFILSDYYKAGGPVYVYICG